MDATALGPAILTKLPLSPLSSFRRFVCFGFLGALPHANAALRNLGAYAAAIADEERMEEASSEGFSSSKLIRRDESPQPLHLAQHQWLR